MQVQQQRGMRRGASGMYSVVVVFFFLYSPLIFLPSLLFRSSTYYKRRDRHRGERDVTGLTLAMVAMRGGTKGQPSEKRG